ncbi:MULTISPECIES: RAMP superfamily CRISPR-associated protein [Streptomyces]|uniref:CRISPR-associated protein n=2 Tax=Streptomyces TaxID=1883 RepID=A0ABP3YTJ6_9ACTN|nr:RAMP superfamily CRISPR-associated protein [Streptomyces sp. LB8]MDN5383357.1 RAMP superfamily CRISPR-associated protein [Streptomyces sp. LB8]
MVREKQPSVPPEGRTQYAGFVNPYTFVPLPELDGNTAFRRTPHHHDRLGPGRLSGRIDVELTLRAPLLVRGIRTGEEGFPRRSPDGGGPAVPFVPGSSLAGAVRSLHELIAGGCLRVFDADFRPGYRDPVRPKGDDWTLALVTGVEHDGRPRLRVCTRVVWAKAEELVERALGGDARALRTGVRVHISDWKREGPRDRARGRAIEEVRQGDGWVVLVGDTGTRTENDGFWCAVGELPEGPAGSQSALPTEEAWENFQRAVADADEVRQDRRDRRRGAPAASAPGAGDEPELVEVHHRGRLVGLRHRVTPRLLPGQVVWVRRGRGAEDEVTDLSLAEVWRHHGRFRAGERVPEALLPCEDVDSLCPTCRVFGSADTSEADGPEQRQASYRGHVRFSDAFPTGPSVPRTRWADLPPLGRPRPGAGQFYLQPRPQVPLPKEKDGAYPLREWGSAADETGGPPRRLRGRKQYWLTGRADKRPYFRVRSGTWEGEMASRAEYVEAGPVFSFSVHVDGLLPEEVGGLLAALDPSLLFGEGTGYAVGGGRPLGFGACTGRITALELTDAAGRYTTRTGSKAPFDAEEAVAAFRKRVTGELPEVHGTWKAVQSVLTLDRVPSEQVWYPTEQRLIDGDIATGNLEPGFAFWKRSKGIQLAKEKRPLIPLPDPTEEDQTLAWMPEESSGDDAPRKGRTR